MDQQLICQTCGQPTGKGRPYTDCPKCHGKEWKETLRGLKCRKCGHILDVEIGFVFSPEAEPKPQTSGPAPLKQP